MNRIRYAVKAALVSIATVGLRNDIKSMREANSIGTLVSHVSGE
jgi:hypothetical protein